jgi:hypothetical protein
LKETNARRALRFVKQSGDARCLSNGSKERIGRLVLAKDEGHGFAKKKNQDFQFYSTVRFVQDHLLQ